MKSSKHISRRVSHLVSHSHGLCADGDGPTSTTRADDPRSWADPDKNPRGGDRYVTATGLRNGYAPSTHHEDGERTASTLTNASHQLSGGCRAVVRAECTAARLLARWYGSRGSRSSRSIRRQQAVGPGSADGVRDDNASFPMRYGERGLDFLGKGRRWPWPWPWRLCPSPSS